MTSPAAPSLDERSSGVLLHPTSLPGPHGSGDLGPGAHRFARFLRAAGQRWWQMLPVQPPGGGASPYDSLSAFAVSPWLLGLEPLVGAGWLEPQEMAPRQDFAQSRVHHPRVAAFREARLRLGFERFEKRGKHAARRELEAFRERTKIWLPDYALFAALKTAHAGAWWLEWDAPLRDRQAAALASARRRLGREIRFHEFVQHQLELQWSELRRTTAELGIGLLGDLPMFVAHDSADVWAHRDLFVLQPSGRQKVVAGVPPDQFTDDGQLWGNPVYRWAAMRRDGFAWWISRLAVALGRFDAVRLDHFIGLSRVYQIEAGAPNARVGRFARVPGAEVLSRTRQVLGRLPLVAEDLGLVTPEVRALRDRFELPGMRVLHFAFGDGEDARDYQPHRYGRRTVVYTGTHDNDTSVGWFRSMPPPLRTRVLRYLGSDGREINWDLIRLALASVAALAIVPLQDLLGLGSEARMNVPGTPTGNWSWRARDAELRGSIAERLRMLSETYERCRPSEASVPPAPPLASLARFARGPAP